jgi:hypothetical protein
MQFNSKPLANAGWQLLDSVSSNQKFFDEFTNALGFDLSKSETIDVPLGALTYDFRETAGCKLDRPRENLLRKIVLSVFRRDFSNTRCRFVNVNHDSYVFDPATIILDDAFNPWPHEVSPTHNYILFSNEDFTEGCFSDPSRLCLIVFGEKLTTEFQTLFTMTPSPPIGK